MTPSPTNSSPPSVPSPRRRGGDRQVCHYREGFDRTPPYWRSASRMPRWGSRITLEVLDVQRRPICGITRQEVQQQGWYEIHRIAQETRGAENDTIRVRASLARQDGLGPNDLDVIRRGEFATYWRRSFRRGTPFRLYWTLDIAWAVWFRRVEIP